MPRAATSRKAPIKTVRKRNIAAKKGSISEAVQIFIARRLLDMVAVLLLGGGLFLLVSLLSYEASDPSWNTSINANADNDEARNIGNWGGGGGAWLADILMQTIGLGALALGGGLAVWGFKLFKRQSVRPFFLRVTSLLISTILLSVALAQIPAGNLMLHPYLGSTAGTILMQNAADLGQSISPMIGPVVIAFVAGILGVLAFLFGAAFTRADLIAMLRKIGNGIAAIFYMVYALGARFIDWVKHYNDPDYAPAAKPLFKFDMLKPAAPKVKASPMIQDDEPAPAAPTLSAPAVDNKPRTKQDNIPVVTPKKTTPQPTNTQQSFALSDQGEWELPPSDLIQTPPPELKEMQLNEEALRKNAELLQNVLGDFKVEGDVVSIYPGPVVTLYELEPSPGTKSSRVIALSDDIARSMSAISVRCAVVPGRNVIGIELPNKERQIVYMQEILNARQFEKTSAKLPLVLGKDIGGQPIIADLAKMPHLLVAGTTGSGKSVAVNTMILSLLFRLPPSKCRFIMIDPKMLELSVYDGIPHLLAPVVTEPGKAIVSLKWAVNEMEERYRSMSKLGVRNIDGYNDRLAEARKNGEVIMQKVQTGFDPETGEGVFEEQEMDLTELPYIVVIVDEFADLMLVAGKDVENAIQRLAQMARAAGIHLIMATQRPSVDVITGVIKANFPTRISFQVTSKIDSRTILGESGAEQLLGMGDMLYMAPGGQVKRVHGPFVSDDDVEQVVNYLKAQGEPHYITGVTDESSDFGDSEVMNAMFGESGSSNDVDELYDKAVAIIAREGKASTSFIQRQLQIGYNRAARIIEEMERQGVVSKANATGKRDVLVGDH